MGLFVLWILLISLVFGQLADNEDPTKNGMQDLFSSLGTIDQQVQQPSKTNQQQQQPMPMPNYPVGSKYSPQALTGLILPNNQYANTPKPQVYGTPTNPNIPSNLNPNLYNGGYPGQNAGYSNVGGANQNNSPNGPIMNQNPIGSQMQSSQFQNPVVGSTVSPGAMNKLLGVGQTQPSIVGNTFGVGALGQMFGNTQYGPITPQAIPNPSTSAAAQTRPTDTSQFNDMFKSYNVGNVNDYGSQPQIQPAANPSYQTVPQGSVYNVNERVEGVNFNRKKRHFYT